METAPAPAPSDVADVRDEWVPFADSGQMLAWAEQLPIGQQAGILEGIDPQALTEADVEAYAAMVNRVLNWAGARQHSARLALHRVFGKESGRQVDLSDVMVAVAEQISPGTADWRIAQSKQIVARLPGLLALQSQGLVTPAHLAVVSEVTSSLSDEQCRAVEEQLRTTALQLTPGLLRRRARKLVAALDPDAFTRRHRRARADRRVVKRPVEDGMALLSLLAPAEGVEALWLRLDGEARALREAGDPRSLDQLRADLMVEAAFAGAGFTADGGGGNGGPCPTCGVGSSRRQRRARVRRRRKHGREVRMVVHVNATTLAGMDDTPGEVEGVGPIPAEVARQMVPKVAEFFRLIYDPETGTCLDYGRLKRRPAQDLTDFVLARDALCRAPGCERPIDDLHHDESWEDGGATAAHNLCGLCQRNHTGTQHGCSTRQTSDGGTVWTSPTGREHERPAEDHRLEFLPRPPSVPDRERPPLDGPCPF